MSAPEPDALEPAPTAERLKLLLVEPYLTGSHRAWTEGLAAATAHDCRVIGLPGRFWKWRMHGGALTCARIVREWDDGWRPDVVLASDMLDLSTFLAATRGVLDGVPAAVYVHEHQLAYPARRPRPEWSASRNRRTERDARDAHYAFINVASLAVADRIFWSSRFNRDSFLERLPGFLRSFPDHHELGLVGEIAGRSEILPLGIDLASLDGPRPIEPDPPESSPRALRIVWNHRWEYDKAPEDFFAALDAVLAAGEDFTLVLLGERFGSVPAAFESALIRFEGRFAHVGFTPSRADYARLLWWSDIVVSTARHEYFGAATCEALYCGCDALLPDRLAYPELVPEPARGGVLYADQDDLARRLVERCRAARAVGVPPAPPALRRAAARFDWSVQAPRYDRGLAEVARRRPAAPSARSRTAPARVAGLPGS